MNMDEIDALRKTHESDREWALRRQFLEMNINNPQMSRDRLICLSHCLISIRCYGCTYPGPVMTEANQLSSGIVTTNLRIGAKPPPAVKFVKSSEQTSKEPTASTSQTNTAQRVTYNVGNMSFVKAGSYSDNAAINNDDSQLKEHASIKPELTASTYLRNNSAPSRASRPGGTFSNISVHSAQSGQPRLNEIPSQKVPNKQQILDKFKALRYLIQSKAAPNTNNLSIVQECTDKRKMALKCEFSEMGCDRNFSCFVFIDFVHVATGKGENKKKAKNVAFDNLLDLLNEEVLGLVEDDTWPGGLRLCSEPDSISATSNKSSTHSYSNVQTEKFINFCTSSGKISTSADSHFQSKRSDNFWGASDKISTFSSNNSQIPKCLNSAAPFSVSQQNSGFKRKFDESADREEDIQTKLMRLSSGAVDFDLKKFVVRVPIYLRESLVGSNEVKSADLEREEMKTIRFFGHLLDVATFNGQRIEYNYENEDGFKVICRIHLHDILLAERSDVSQTKARELASHDALVYLCDRCPVLYQKHLNYEDCTEGRSVDTLDRDEVLQNDETTAGSEDTMISDSNVGSKLLKKMGWSGEGGVGKPGREGIAEPINLSAAVNREGLGLAATKSTPKDLRLKITQVLTDYVRKSGEDDLVFDPTFTSDERAIIHRIAHKFGLVSRSTGSEPDRYLVVSFKRTPTELLEYIRSNGGETYKYLLQEPSL